jgi:hypothetical protein
LLPQPHPRSVAVPIIGRAAEEAAKPKSETLVATLFKSLNDAQRKALCFSFDHPLRTGVDNNWHVVDEKIGSFPQRRSATDGARNLPRSAQSGIRRTR